MNDEAERQAGKKVIEEFFSILEQYTSVLGEVNAKGEDYANSPEGQEQLELAYSIGQRQADLMADDVEWYMAGVPTNNGYVTKKDLAAMVRLLRHHAASKMDWEFVNWTIEGNKYAVECRSRMKHTSGRIYSNRYHFFIKIENGKIAIMREYLDTAHVRDVFALADMSAFTAQ